jgi:hypothetical protein
VVANQKLDEVSLRYRVPGTNEFGAPIPITGSQRLPLLAPGAVQTFYAPDDPNPYMAVANSLSNDALLYHYDPATGYFGLLTSYAVGDDPVSITVGSITGSKVPDLAVANQGSNDISILIGAMDPVTQLWTATAYQRVSSGGSGPVGVSFVQQPGSTHGPDLITTNSDGTLAVVPGIGSGGTGTGFFASPNAHVLTVGGQPLGPVTNGLVATTQGIFAVNPSTLTATEVLVSSALTGISVGANGDVAAGFSDGRLELLEPEGGQLAEALVFRDAQLTDPSALQLGATEIYATNTGEDRIFVFALSAGIAVPSFTSPFESRGQEAAVQPLSGAGLFLVATFVTNPQVENPIGEAALAEGGFGVGIGILTRGMVANLVLVNGGNDFGDAADSKAQSVEGTATSGTEARPAGQASPSPQAGSPLNEFISGVGEALGNIRQQIRDERGAPPADPDPAGPQGLLDPFVLPSRQGSDEAVDAAAPGEEVYRTDFVPGVDRMFPSPMEQSLAGPQTEPIGAAGDQSRPDAFAGPGWEACRQRLVLSLLVCGVWQLSVEYYSAATAQRRTGAARKFLR